VLGRKAQLTQKPPFTFANLVMAEEGKGWGDYFLLKIPDTASRPEDEKTYELQFGIEFKKEYGDLDLGVYVDTGGRQVAARTKDERGAEPVEMAERRQEEIDHGFLNAEARSVVPRPVSPDAHQPGKSATRCESKPEASARQIASSSSLTLRVTIAGEKSGLSHGAT